ncbi:hypothetical protein GCM10017674_24660 [Streptomyces gardneri]|uniref:Uncharacterized protein n=1 Tax=Streptomyces gardneri TaxID=66892 RepID=A0A4Y3RQ16_9ACTN|nr:hypothetical protein SGA01_52770 [Streptomyces gardneri]GHG94280.1 hypothetical protein GCM10017674_24660 [Streptomyces gardneri]
MGAVGAEGSGLAPAGVTRVASKAAVAAATRVPYGRRAPRVLRFRIGMRRNVPRSTPAQKSAEGIQGDEGDRRFVSAEWRSCDSGSSGRDGASEG